jgi:hypothetical protein
MLSPRRGTQVLLLAAVLGICDQSYWQYSNVDHYFAGYWMPFVRGAGLAPEQYRIGVKMAAWWLVQHFSWGFRYGFTLMDVIASTTGVLLIYDLLQRKAVIRSANTALQWFASAGFLFLMCYYLIWVGFFFRPETLPSLGLTACMAWLWTRPPVRASGSAVVILGLLAAAAVQAWIRADLPCALNAGMFLVSLTRTKDTLSISRRAALVTSLACIGVAAGTQLYIMRVMYPHASYGQTPLIMLVRDYRQPLGYPPFLVFMLPLAWLGVQAWRQWSVLDAGSRGLLIGAAIYFVLWVVLGKLDEVRIFIPFAVVLIPMTMELAVRRIAPNRVLAANGGYEAEV